MKNCEVDLVPVCPTPANRETAKWDSAIWDVTVSFHITLKSYKNETDPSRAPV